MHKLPEIIGKTQKATQLVYILWLWPRSDCFNLSRINLEPFSGDNVSQIQELGLVEITLQKLSIQLVIPKDLKHFS